MYMIRNPWGTTTYNQDWNSLDEKWTDDYISQVPFDVDPRESHLDGIFFVEDKDFLTCFDDF